MQLTRKRSASSFYESFSDLIFCALVLFVALVMVLAANVGVQVESLQEAEGALAKVQASLESSKQHLQSVVNTHRYTGAFSPPSLSIAINADVEQPTFFFMPRQTVDNFSIPIINETEEEAVLRQRTAITAMGQAVKLQRGLTESQFYSVLRAFSYHKVAGADWPYLGVQLQEADNLLTIVGFTPQSTFPIDTLGSMLLAVEGKPVQSVSQIRQLLQELDDSQESVAVLIQHQTEQQELRIKVLRNLYDGMTLYNDYVANAVAAQWRLTAEGLEMERPSANLPVEELTHTTYEQTIENARTAFASCRVDLGTDTIDEPVTILRVYASADSVDYTSIIGEVPFNVDEFLLLLASINNGNVAIQFVDAQNQPVESIPAWVQAEVLVPAGFTNRSPDVQGIQEWLDKNSATSDSPSATTPPTSVSEDPAHQYTVN